MAVAACAVALIAAGLFRPHVAIGGAQPAATVGADAGREPPAGVLLRHSDYAGMARALGAHGERVEKAEDMPGALKRALENAPALIDVVTSQTVLSSDAKKGLGTVHDYQALETWNAAELKRRGK